MMRLPDTVRCVLAMMTLMVGAVLSEAPVRAAEPAAEEKREMIGKVLEKPVYRDQIRKDQRLAGELHRLFSRPVMMKYRKEHEADVTPSPAEIDAATTYFDQKHRERIKDMESELRDKLKAVEASLKPADLPVKQRQELEVKKRTLEAQLNPPGRPFAEFVLNNWKFQRHLYDEFGGGRILWQQAGIEAFDATRVWLETQEENGEFEITDPALRETFYTYWTTQKHGAFLTADKDRIRREFLEPEWAQRKAK